MSKNIKKSSVSLPTANIHMFIAVILAFVIISSPILSASAMTIEEPYHSLTSTPTVINSDTSGVSNSTSNTPAPTLKGGDADEISGETAAASYSPRTVSPVVHIGSNNNEVSEATVLPGDVLPTFSGTVSGANNNEIVPTNPSINGQNANEITGQTVTVNPTNIGRNDNELGGSTSGSNPTSSGRNDNEIANPITFDCVVTAGPLGVDLGGPYTGDTKNYVYFTVALSDLNASISKTEMDFGDNHTSDGITTNILPIGNVDAYSAFCLHYVHTYTVGGVYTAKFTATTDKGVVVTDTAQVTIQGTEDTASLCSDSADNDLDGLVDLSDPDCAAFVPPTTSTGGGHGHTSGSSGNSNTSSSSSTSCPLITTYMRMGANNDGADVTRLQSFFKNSENLSVDVNGIFDAKTDAATRAFQSKYQTDILGPWSADLSSGYVYITTSKKINELACETPFTLSGGDLAIIEAYKKQKLAAAGGQTTPVAGPSVDGAPSTSDTNITPASDDNSTPTIEVGSNDQSEQNANVAAVGGTSIFARLWNFIKGIF